jgi:hypothetical protein
MIMSGKGPLTTGPVTLRSDDAGDYGDSGVVTIASGDAALGNSGAIKITTGSSSDSGGAITLEAGLSEGDTGAGVSISAGDTQRPYMEGGNVSVSAGDSTGDYGFGGSVVLNGGGVITMNTAPSSTPSIHRNHQSSSR